jgi:endonuclease III
MKEQCIDKLKQQLKKTILDINLLQSKYNKLKTAARKLEEKFGHVTHENARLQIERDASDSTNIQFKV